MLRLRRDLEPHSAVVLGQTPTVAQRVDEEEPAAAFLRGPAAYELRMPDAGTGISHLAADAFAAGHERELDRTARAMSYRVRDELRDDHLQPPPVLVRDVAGRLAHCFARTLRCMAGCRQFQRNRSHARSIPGPLRPTRRFARE